MHLRAELNYEPHKSHIDVHLSEYNRPGNWIWRVVWDRDWARRPQDWRPFQQDPGGYCKYGQIMSGWHFACGRFAIMLYRPNTAISPMRQAYSRGIKRR